MTEDAKYKVISSTPAIVADGHGLGISEDGAWANIQFIQMVNKNEETGQSDVAVVANIRVPYDQLVKFNADLGQLITDQSKDKEAKA